MLEKWFPLSTATGGLYIQPGAVGVDVDEHELPEAAAATLNEPLAEGGLLI